MPTSYLLKSNREVQAHGTDEHCIAADEEGFSDKEPEHGHNLKAGARRRR